MYTGLDLKYHQMEGVWQLGLPQYCYFISPFDADYIPLSFDWWNAKYSDEPIEVPTMEVPGRCELRARPTTRNLH